MLRIIGKIIKFVLPVVIILAGIHTTLTLIESKPQPKSRKGPTEKVKLVRVKSFESLDHLVIVKAQATTSPQVELAIAPQVNGRVIWVSPSLVEGGRVKKNQPLFKIDPVDYQLQLQQAQAVHAKATYELDLIAAQKKGAESGIKIYQKMTKNKTSLDIKKNISSLARYEPQIALAKTELDSAEANLKQAELNLKRTEVSASFSGFIRSTSLAIGQIISSGQTVAKMFKDKPVILKIALPASELQWILIKINFQKTDQKNSKVLVSKQIGGIKHKWNGEIKRQLQEIDSLGRLMTVIAEVTQPVSDKGFTLPMGMLVNVEIKGKTLKNVYGIPQNALRKDSTLWVFSKDNRLEIRSVNVIRKNENLVFISQGLNAEDQIVVTQIPSAVQGMKLSQTIESSRPKVVKDEKKSYRHKAGQT